MEFWGAEGGEKWVCDLVTRVGSDRSTIWKHLSVLRTAGIVDSRKEGLNVIYRLKTPCVYQFMKCIDKMNGNRECALVCSAIEQGIERSEG